MKNMGKTYHVLNLYTKCIVLGRDVIWLKKTFDKYVVVFNHNKSYEYVLKEKDAMDKWSKLKTDTIRTENMNKDQFHRVEENLMTIYLLKKKSKQKNNISMMKIN